MNEMQFFSGGTPLPVAEQSGSPRSFSRSVAYTQMSPVDYHGRAEKYSHGKPQPMDNAPANTGPSRARNDHPTACESAY